jgi:hypothetical protein
MFIKTVINVTSVKYIYLVDTNSGLLKFQNYILERNPHTISTFKQITENSQLSTQLEKVHTFTNRGHYMCSVPDQYRPYKTAEVCNRVDNTTVITRC